VRGTGGYEETGRSSVDGAMLLGYGQNAVVSSLFSLWDVHNFVGEATAASGYVITATFTRKERALTR
jgi:hypothetical protein